MPLVLETERLRLRLPAPTDVDALQLAYGDPEVMRFVGDGTPFSRQRTAAEIELYRQRWERDGFSTFVVETREERTIVGDVGFAGWDPETWHYGVAAAPGRQIEIELGWTLARDAWGRGYATEAARAARDWAFTELRPPRLISMIFPANERSQRVATRIGAHFERELVTASGKLTQLWSTEPRARGSGSLGVAMPACMRRPVLFDPPPIAPEGRRWRGPPLPPTLSYGLYLTVVVTLEVLFAWFGSVGDVELTVAVSTAAPLAVGFTVTVTVAVAPAARLPSEHVTVPFPAVQLPWLVVDAA
jgi:RimJ/RimL family protein N-acetyltransferase